MLNTVRICWRRHSGVYRADCRCGETSEHPKLTAAEKWATAHRCKETTMRPPGVADTLTLSEPGVISGNPERWLYDGDRRRHRGAPMTRPPAVARLLESWDEEGPSPLRSAAAIDLVAWVKTLEQRNAAARMHIARARVEGLATASGYDAGVSLDAELCAALDVLAGDA